jgi:hypothetical protein
MTGAAPETVPEGIPETARESTPATRLSPYTGWTRADFTALADRMLLGARRHASPSASLITPPGAPGGYGTAVDGLEGFARTFLLAGFRIAGERGADPLNLLDQYASGLAAGADPGSSERWVTPREHPQAKVEAASIALILDLTRPYLWDRLDDRVREQLIAYLAQVVGDPTYPNTNWVWFRIVVEQFLASVGGPWSRADLEADLAAHDAFVRADGWYCDGDERNYDHYCGWALHLYPILWSRMAGAAEYAAPRLPAYKAHLDRFLPDALRLVGADGSPLIQGRSLTYRFAAAAPFWIGALADTTAADPGLLRRAAAGIVKHFAEHGAPDADDLLTIGWHHPWRRLAQRYSGPGSPYWAAKGLLGLALPADHPVWTSPEQPLPVEESDQLAVIAAPGWALSATRADGIVRVYNHGTDHALPGDTTGDSPLYARFGYSTATAPLLSEEGWDAPLDQSVVLLDAHGRATHRTGFRTLRMTEVGDAAVLASRARCHWVDPDRTVPDHGSGRPGAGRDAATVTTVSLVRGAWEVRCVHLAPDGAPGWDDAVALRIGGWPVTPGGHRSMLVNLQGFAESGTHEADDATPLSARTTTPWLRAAPRAGAWYAAALALNGGPDAPGAEIFGPADAPAVTVSWPDGATTTTALPAPPAVPTH